MTEIENWNCASLAQSLRSHSMANDIEGTLSELNRALRKMSENTGRIDGRLGGLSDRLQIVETRTESIARDVACSTEDQAKVLVEIGNIQNGCRERHHRVDSEMIRLEGLVEESMGEIEQTQTNGEAVKRILGVGKKVSFGALFVIWTLLLLFLQPLTQGWVSGWFSSP